MVGDQGCWPLGLFRLKWAMADKPTDGGTKGSEKRARLAASLRENLKRRKEQARMRAEPAAGEDGKSDDDSDR